MMLPSQKKYLAKVLARYQELIQQLAEKSVIANLNLYTKIKKEIKLIEDLALNFQMFCQIEVELTEWKGIVEKELILWDEGLKEISRLEAELSTIETKIQNLQATKLEAKQKHTIIEIRGAVGGREANLFAGDLFNMYINFCKAKKWKYEIWELNKTEAGGYNLIIFLIKNATAYSSLKYEAGVHRVQRVPKTESMGRVHTSTATVAVLEEKNVEDFPIADQEIRVDTFRSSGAGGQHVNTTDSAVRVTHLPSGLSVSCQEGRSQHDNKDKALKVLRARLFQKKQTQLNQENVQSRNQQIGEGERSEKIRTYNFLQNRVTDHRINWSYKGIEQIVNGKLDILLTKLTVLQSQTDSGKKNSA